MPRPVNTRPRRPAVLRPLVTPVAATTVSLQAAHDALVLDPAPGSVLRSMAFLLHGDQRRALGPGVLSIGSGVEAAWRFRVPELARLHALVTQDAGGNAALMRASPEAEVQLNGEVIGGEARRLAPGDVIRLGELEFRFENDAPIAESAGPARGHLRDARRDRVHVLHRDVTVIGRDPSSDIVVQEPEVARLHLRVERDGETVRLVPQAGPVTLLNGARVEKTTILRDNDAIGIGRTVLFFTHEPPKRHPLENAQAINTERYTRRLGTGVLGVVVRREEREEQERRRTRLTVLAVVVLLAVAALGFVLWRSGVLETGPAALLERLG